MARLPRAAALQRSATKTAAVCVGVVCAATAGGEIAGVLPILHERTPKTQDATAAKPEKAIAPAQTHADADQRGAQRGADDTIPGAIRGATHAPHEPDHRRAQPQRRRLWYRATCPWRALRAARRRRRARSHAVDRPVDAVGAERLEPDRLEPELGAVTERDQHSAARPTGLRTRRPWMLKATTGWGRRMKGHRPPARRATAAIAVTALLSLAVIGALPGSAYAGVWMQTSCANPDQSAASSEGWTGGSTGTPSRGSTNNTNCDPSNPMYAGLGNASPAPSGSGQYLQYTPPAGSRLVGGSLLAGLSADGYGDQAVGTAAIMTPAFQYDATNVFLQCVAALYQCQNGTFNYFGVVDIPANRGGNLYLSAGCVGQTAAKNCSMGGSHNAWALVSVFYARLLLSADSPPTATEFGGSLLSDGAHGTATLSFTASDTGGPGIYKATVAIDGTTIYDDTPNTNAGKCAAVGTDAASGALMFASQQPCPQVQRVVIPVSTTRLKDGEHEVTVTLRTAAGNTSTVLVQTITTTNRTTVSGELTSDAPPPPAIAAAPEPVYAMVLDAPTQALLRGVKRAFTRSGLTLSGTLRNSAGVPAPGVAADAAGPQRRPRRRAGARPHDQRRVRSLGADRAARPVARTDDHLRLGHQRGRHDPPDRDARPQPARQRAGPRATAVHRAPAASARSARRARSSSSRPARASAGKPSAQPCASSPTARTR